MDDDRTHAAFAIWFLRPIGLFQDHRGSICMQKFDMSCRRYRSAVLPQILGSLPEVIRSCHHHHHHHTLPKVFAERCTNARSRGALAFTSQPPEPSGGRPWEAAFGQRHPSSPASRRVRSAGRDTWNLTGEALGGPRKRSWRRCSRARSGRRSAIRGAHSGTLDRPEPSDPAARAPIRTSAPYSAADASGSSCAAGARLR